MISEPVLSDAQKARNACIEALKSGRCACGNSKQTGMAFCYRCWLQLPRNVRQALYRKIGEGFEAAYDVGCQFLQFKPKEATHGERDASAARGPQGD